MQKALYVILFLALCLIWFVYMADSRVCKFAVAPVLTIATVTQGLFIETIPQTGISDTISERRLNVKVEIDELYFKRISVGLKAIAQINSADLNLIITEVDTTIIDGRFSVRMHAMDSLHKKIPKNLRLRIELSEPRNALLLPVGGFYKDTGGKWVFILQDNNRAVRKDITLGPHNPDYFEVLGGLKPGDKVVTSSYEDFSDQTSIVLAEIKGRKSIKYIK